MTKVEDRHRAEAQNIFTMELCLSSNSGDYVNAIAIALAEAEKRGAETEREACAEEAESQWAYCSPRHVAAAIRARSSQ